MSSEDDQPEDTGLVLRSRPPSAQTHQVTRNRNEDQQGIRNRNEDQQGNRIRNDCGIKVGCIVKNSGRELLKFQMPVEKSKFPDYQFFPIRLNPKTFVQ